MVEDEALIVEIMAEALEDEGYEVLTAATGPEALALIEARPHHFSGLISDFHLPGGLTGLDVATAILARRPSIPIVLATGRPDVLESHWRAGHTFSLLRKPYGPSEMLELLRSLVAPARPGLTSRSERFE